MTAFHGIEACGSLLARTVLVPGAAGSVGYYATQLARIAGARVIALVSSKEKAAIARRAGATEAIDYRREDTGRRVRELTSGRGADFIIDVDAASHSPHYGEILARGGKAIVYGSNARELTLPFGPMILGFVSLYFYIVYRLPPETMQRTVAGITQLLAADALTHPELAVYPLEEIVAAHERVERGANAKVLLRL
jgi:NADPH2:quinone reductase